MKRKKSICAILLLTMLLMLGCGTMATDYSNTTLTGMITELDGTKVTMQLGTLSEQEPMNNELDEQLDGGQTEPPPAKPEGDSNDLGGDKPGEQLDGRQIEQPLAKSEGADNGSEGNKPDGQPAGNAPGGMVSFSASEEVVQIDLTGAAVQIEGMGKIDTGSLEDLALGDVLVVEVGDKNQVSTVTVKQVMGGTFGSSEVRNGTSANTIEEDGSYTGKTYTSIGDDENALRIDGATVTLENVSIEKSNGATSNTENGDFYGQNAGLLALNGAQVTIQNAVVNTAAQNGNGIFSYGEGTAVYIADSVINTTADNSGGIQTTGGGTTYASNLTIETEGSSSAAIRSDRGGGVVVVEGGSYISKGYNSPAVYSTADITIKGAELIAKNSEALVVEGKNSITLENCNISGNMSDTQGTSSDENVHNVMIYQSMSGDADVGTSALSITGGTLTSNNGDLFYVTNTHCLLTLADVTINNQGQNGYFLRVSGNSGSRGWGTAGANGAQTELTLDGQILEGDIVVDTISALDILFTNGSNFTGTVNIVENEQNGAVVADNAVITIEKGCVWTLTGDCSITSLDNQGTVNYNGYTITLADGTVLHG